MTWLKTILVLLVLLMTDLNEGRRALAYRNRHRGCKFPPEWHGIWFQSTVRPYIAIRADTISSKGTCLHSKDNEKFIIRESDNCYKCVVFHQRAPNVLQYKETFGCSRLKVAASDVTDSDVSDMCLSIPGDAHLFSMFRVDGNAVHCPFHGAMEFSYNRGKGECSWPKSEMASCEDETRVVFNYQACPNVQGSEMMSEELECLATWRDGSQHFLMGRMSHLHATSDEDKFRCFLYDIKHDDEGKTVVHVAQSGDATCNGLFSARDGPRTLTMRTAKSKIDCQLPRWFTQKGSWNSLDQGKSLVITANQKNSSYLSLEQTVLKVHGGSIGAEYFVRDSNMALCHKKQGDKFILYKTVGCKTGFVCMDLQRKSRSIISLRLGDMSRTADYACDNVHFGTNVKRKLLVAAGEANGLVDTRDIIEDNKDIPEHHVLPRGLYKVTSPSSMEFIAALRTSSKTAEVKSAWKSNNPTNANSRDTVVDDDQCRDFELVFGCHKSSQNSLDELTVRSACEKPVRKIIKDYTLVHHWQEPGKPGNLEGGAHQNQNNQYLVFRPQSRPSSERGTSSSFVCFRFHEQEDSSGVSSWPPSEPARNSTSRRLMVVERLDENCLPVKTVNDDKRNNQEIELAFQGDCSQVGNGGRGVVPDGTIRTSLFMAIIVNLLQLADRR